MVEIHSAPDSEEQETLPEAVSNRTIEEVSRASWWWLVLALIAGLVGATFVVGFIWLSLVPLLLFILGMSVAAALSPVVDLLSRRMNRILGILLIYLVGLGLVALILWLVIPALIAESQMLIKTAPGLIDTAQGFLNRYGIFSNLNIVNSIKTQIGSAAKIIISLPVGIFYSLFEVIVVVFVSLYALALEPGIERFYFSLFPNHRRQRLEYILGQVTSAMGGYVRASFLDGLAMAVAAYIGFLIIGIHFPLVLAVITGVLELIPTLGPLAAGALATGFALLQSPTQALIVLIFFIVLQQLETHVLVPNVMRTQTDISPLWVVFALLVGFEIGGLLGALVAIPIAGMIKVAVVEFIAPAIRRQTGAQDRSVTAAETDPPERPNSR